jgi:predicted dehydrogenase
MIRIGLVGVGFMGMMHYHAAQRLRGGRVTAVHTRNPARLAGDWTGIRGNFGPAGTHMDLSHLHRHARYDDLLADPAVDLVDLCTPPDQHEEMTIAALQAGKHVLVEKPIALEADAADRMVAAADRAGRLLLVAQVLPFFPEFAYAYQAIVSGTHGRLLGGHFKRVIARPDWSASLGDASRDGGPAIDLHIHDTHFIGLVAGVPKQVFANGVVAGDGSVAYLTTQYLYGPGGPALSCSSGALCMASRPFVHGYEIYLERATLVYESGTCPLTLLPAEGTPRTPELPGGGDDFTAFAAELELAVTGVATGTEPALLRGSLARDALRLCHKEIESVRGGRPVACGG